MSHSAVIPPLRAGVSSGMTPSLNEDQRLVLPRPQLIVDVPIHPIGVVALMSWIHATVDARRRGVVMYANAHNITLAQENPLYKKVLQDASLVFCDGVGVQWASRLWGTSLPERMTMPDWIVPLMEMAEQQGWHLFFLGGEVGVSDQAATNLVTRYPGLKITTYHGFFDKEGAENQAVLTQINKAQPTLLLVGMGPPRQEFWIHANQSHHCTAVTLAVGNLFDYLAGEQKRGPQWLTTRGGEWLWRLTREPQRLWRRYLLGNPRFLFYVIRYRLTHPPRPR